MVWGDYDNDGNLDIYVANQSTANLLYQNNGNGTFTNVASSAGVNDSADGQGMAFGDHDNDGDLDLYVVNRGGSANRLYQNNGNGTFTDIASSAGVNDSVDGRGITLGDYDNDGDLDIYTGNVNSANRLYQNTGNSNRWLQVKLTGTASNKDGIGARVTAVTGSLRQIRDADGGSGYLSQLSIPVEFGFGGTTTIDSLIIRWPSGTVQVMTSVATNQTLTATEPLPPDLQISGKIVFQSGRDGNLEIYVMNADGTNQTRLTNNSATDANPSWSPDGTKIAFRANRDGNNEIYVMNADGTNQTRLTNNPASDAGTSWSPDGTKITFISWRDGGDREVYVINADGTNETRLTNSSGEDSGPSWSPDGTKIALRSDRDGNAEIFAMNTDGTNLVNLTNHSGHDEMPSWSPDGTKIAFRSDRDGNPEIYVMNADGTNQTNLTNNSGSDYLPYWSSDGTEIVFYSTRDGNSEIYVMDADGTNQTNLTNNSATDGDPSWGEAFRPLLEGHRPLRAMVFSANLNLPFRKLSQILPL